ncbi:MAG: aminoglycoside phosphotransferase family protein [Roseiflexus sp.]|nr:aminoglycoside phosphotransferase family protein [Roseiflexus sp.]MCS7288363.1 aminoglycoside phosphotransferase family protein [Roseiflexus sp.]MDW8231208.1 phosphotransferase [Roseiflexaceae bacterium]
MWAHLNHYLPDDPAYSDAMRRVMARLGDYAAAIVEPLKARPMSATLVCATNRRIEVRITTATTHLLLVIAPDSNLAHEVFFLRMLAAHDLPAPRLITHDLSCTSVPFTYALETYPGSLTLASLNDAALVRVAGRKIGRVLRRIHRIEAPGFGAPTSAGRWSASTWREALAHWLEQRNFDAQAEAVLGSDLAVALRSATLDHPALACAQPRVVHGAIEPSRVVISAGESVQLEGLVRPEAPVGGDPLFDLAYALSSCQSPVFRRSVLEGYEAGGTLTAEHYARLDRLRLLIDVAYAFEMGDPAVLAGLPAAVMARLGELS